MCLTFKADDLGSVINLQNSPHVNENTQTYMVCTPREVKVSQHTRACDHQWRPGTWKMKTRFSSNHTLAKETAFYLENWLYWGEGKKRQKHFNLKTHRPHAVFSAGELCQDTGAEPGLFSLTLDHHTSTDKQLLRLCHAVKSDVVTGDQDLPFLLKADLVF